MAGRAPIRPLHKALRDGRGARWTVCWGRRPVVDKTFAPTVAKLRGLAPNLAHGIHAGSGAAPQDQDCDAPIAGAALADGRCGDVRDGPTIAIHSD